jgi:hypothetical protein
MKKTKRINHSLVYHFIKLMQRIYIRAGRSICPNLFQVWFRNELNTYENTYQKDLVEDGVIKVRFWLTAEEQNKILDR